MHRIKITEHQLYIDGKPVEKHINDRIGKVSIIHEAGELITVCIELVYGEICVEHDESTDNQ